MKTGARILLGLVALLGAGAALAGTRRLSQEPVAQAFEGAPGDFWTRADAAMPSLPTLSDLDAWWAQSNFETAMNTQANTPPAMNAEANIAALLEAIKWAEGTARERDPYRVCYGYTHTIRSFADHPRSLGEWAGVVLTDEQCRGAGLGPGCKSTAAGAYQITVTTWREVKARLNLPDFSPASQDRAAVDLLRKVGALDNIRRGDLSGAIAAARGTWASLPGAGYAGQPERKAGQLQAVYLQAGGALA